MPAPEPRIDLLSEARDAYRGVLALERAIHASDLDPTIRELIKIRASQINGCAFCLDMHTKDARAAGETEQRIVWLSAWREAPAFTARERAALALAEAITDVAHGGVPDAVYAEAAEHFPATELAHLVMAIVAINSWNRMAIATRSPVPGSYQAGDAKG